MGPAPELKVVKIRRRKGEWKADTCNPAAGDSVQWKSKDPDIRTFTVFFPKENVFGTRLIEGTNGETPPIQLAAGVKIGDEFDYSIYGLNSDGSGVFAVGSVNPVLIVEDPEDRHG